MRSPRATLIIVLPLLALIAGATVLWQKSHDPLCDGQRLSAWIGQLEDERPEIHEASANACRKLGAQAVPALAHALRIKDSRIRIALIRWTRNLPVLKFRSLDSARLRAQAAGVLSQLGGAAWEAAPELTAALGDPSDFVADRSQEALQAIGAPAMPTLINALAAQNPNIRRRASEILGSMPEAGDAVALALADGLDDSEISVRRAAARSIGRLIPMPEVSVPALGRRLADSSGSVREECALALSRFGPLASAAASELVSALTDNSDGVRIAAANALGRIGMDAPHAAISALTKNLDHSSSLVRSSSALALGRIGPQAFEATARLALSLKDLDGATRAEAASALGRIGPAAAESVPSLEQALNDDIPATRACAAQALGKIGEAARVSVPALIRAWNNDHSGIGHAVLDALRRLTPDVAAQLSNTGGEAR